MKTINILLYILIYFIFLLCSQTVTPVCKISSEIAKLPAPVQIKPIIIASKEEKPPVICRVLKKSDKDSYNMYVMLIKY